MTETPGQGRERHSGPATHGRWLPDVFGIALVFAAAVAVLLPALVHGLSLGPFDYLHQFGLLKTNATAHNPVTGDQVDEMIPWVKLAWTQVHHGQLPLWNGYSGTGMPLAFNWQSGVFSVPALVSYLFPLSVAFTVQVMVTLLIAGSGAYVFARVLRLGVLGSVFAAVAFELSGPFIAWLGWPASAVMSWAGWLFAAAVLVYRGRRRLRSLVLFAVVLACALYAGQPDTMVLLLLAVAVFFLALVIRRPGTSRGRIAAGRPILDLCVGVVAGGALAAPLALPALQVTRQSIRLQRGGDHALPVHDLTHLVFQSFDGLPLAGSQWFAPHVPGSHWFGDGFYLENATYVALAVLVLGVMALAVRRRNRELRALAVVAVLGLLLAFAPPAVAVMNHLPLIGVVHWHRAFAPMAFAVAMLGGAGIDVIAKGERRQTAQRWSAAGFLVVGIVLASLWLFGRGELPAAQAAIRRHSFVWPAVEVLTGLIAVGIWIITTRRQGRTRSRARAAGLLPSLLITGSLVAFLLATESPLIPSSRSFFPTTPAEAHLARIAGQSTVGLGNGVCFSFGGSQLGILPEANAAYGVHELAVYDPSLPRSYYRSWEAATGSPYTFPIQLSVFCPAVTSVDLARLYGVAYVLEPVGDPGPSGAVLAATLGDETLFRVPGSGAATLIPLQAGRALPSRFAVGAVLPVGHPDPATWRVATRSSGPSLLRLHVTDLPGWHATLDGHPLRLQHFADLMVQARIPAGSHVVSMSYWPATFSLGIAIAICSGAGLALAALLSRRRAAGRRPRGGALATHSPVVIPAPAPAPALSRSEV